MNKGIKPVRKTQNNKRPYLLTVERFGHWQYVAMVRDMWSFCVVKQLSGSRRAVIGSHRHSSAVVRQSSGRSRAVVGNSSGSCQGVVGQPLSSHLAIINHTSGSRQVD